MLLKPLSATARFLVCFGLTMPCLLITVACLLTFKDQGRMETAFEWVRHTLEVENRIHQLVLAAHELDATQHSYLYTSRAAYLETYRAVESRIPVELGALRRCIAHDPDQQQRLMEMEALVADRVDLARQTIELKKTGHQDLAVKLSRADRGKRAMESIDTVAQEMRHDEEILLASRDETLLAARRTHARWLWALLVLNISSLACILLLLRRLGKAQSLARICAWSKRIEHEGQWITFEDYLSRRFSIGSTHTICPPELNRVLTQTAPESPEREPVSESA